MKNKNDNCDSLIEILHLLDEKLDEICQNIVSNLMDSSDFDDEVFDSFFVFDNVENRPWKLRGKKGIYIFKVVQDVPLTRDQVRGWNDRCKGAGFNDWYQRDSKVGDILYVGSCISESLYVRTRQHFFSETTATSLQLGHPSRKMAYDSVKVYAYPISSKYDRYYRYIIPQIEKKLHILLKPKAGSSRV